jgi:protein-arginine deiminase
VLVVANSRTLPLVDALRRILMPLGVPVRALAITGGDAMDIWVQDAIKFACVQPATPDLRAPGVIAFRSLRPNHEYFDTTALDQFLVNWSAARGISVVTLGDPRPGSRWMDWFGNLQVTPPLAGLGDSYLAGRILVGRQDNLDPHPGIMSLFGNHKQGPALVIDTSWLRIGHVDEVLCFVPVDSPPGFRILIPSTILAKTILENAIAAGWRQAGVFSRTNQATTVEELLISVADSAENSYIQQQLGRLEAMLRAELHVPAESFIRVPALFRDGVAVIPNCVNALVCDRTLIVVSPHGPVIGGADAFIAPVAAALQQYGLSLHTIDLWETCHQQWGGLHCATNVLRDFQQPLPYSNHNEHG